jgi:predicted lipoprotein with Yx(FWY)xxD motif
MSRRFRAAAAAAATSAFVLGAAACGSPAQPAPPAAVQLWTTSSPIGTVVIEAAGNVAYRSDADTNQPPTSTCLDACTQTWLPIVTNGRPVHALGVAADQVGSITRPDGTQQVTLHGWPLYTHVADDGLSGAGPNGTDGRWFAVGPTGEKASPTPAR